MPQANNSHWRQNVGRWRRGKSADRPDADPLGPLALHRFEYQE